VTAPGGPAWLARTVMYEIYPQSFSDSDGDGVGDLRGVIGRLDYLAWLGVDSLWLNPCFASPMRDAGYDVSDYLSVAPRYGGNEDLAALVDAAGSRGIRVLLDLVAGHTSDQHPWFLAARDDPGDGRYIFADSDAAPGPQWEPSPGRRAGFYLPNFFAFQPALNFGYARMSAAQPWRQPVDAPGPAANRAALREIIAHWLDLGVAGFRVDLASTLVKDDPGWLETAALWREIRGWLDRRYPEAALMSEWDSPAVAMPAGFHADFYLAVGDEHRSLLDNGTGLAVPGSPARGPCYFSAAGAGSFEPFLAAWRRDVAAAGDAGLIALFSSDHDFARPACGDRTADQLGPVFAFLLTWPALPGIHCGDEIGMRFLPGLPDTEGSQIWPGWNRAGSRTPVQWEDGPNAGFSAAPPGGLYLPVDPDPGRPTVAAQQADETSLLHQVRRLIGLRKTVPALRSGGPAQVLHAGYPLVYTRGGTHLVVINPRREPASFTLPWAGRVPGADGLAADGVIIDGDQARAGGFSYGVFAL
jgi:glycosidase